MKIFIRKPFFVHPPQKSFVRYKSQIVKVDSRVPLTNTYLFCVFVRVSGTMSPHHKTETYPGGKYRPLRHTIRQPAIVFFTMTQSSPCEKPCIPSLPAGTEGFMMICTRYSTVYHHTIEYLFNCSYVCGQVFQKVYS